MRLLSSNEDEPVALSSPGQSPTSGFNSWLNNAVSDLLVFRDYSLAKAFTESESVNNLAVRKQHFFLLESLICKQAHTEHCGVMGGFVGTVGTLAISAKTSFS